MRPGVTLCRSLCPIRAQVSQVLVSGGLFDAPLRLVLLAGDAFGVDPQQHVHAVARPLGDLGAGTPALSQVDTAACRRSPGRGANIRQPHSIGR
jgi:hypothetical protein